MTRRRLYHLLVGVASWLPACVWAQQPARLPTVGILSDGGPATCASLARGYPASCMVDELRALGHVEGRNVTFAYRYAQSDYARLPALAAELVGLRPDVVYTLTGAGAEAAAKATTTIPIVVGPAGEIILAKLAGNLARPTRNVTGQTLDTGQQSLKCLQLLKEVAPRTALVAVIYNPDNPALVAGSLRELGPAAAQLGLAVVRVQARGVAELPRALAAVAASGADAIMMYDEGALAASGDVRKLVSDWAFSHRVPVVSANVQFAADGALLSLGTDVAAVARRAAFYVHRILEGAKPADLPVERPTVFKLSVNRKTASALGLTIPQALLLRADEVIQ